MRRQPHSRTGQTLWHAPAMVALRFAEAGAIPAAKFTVHWAYLRPDYPFMASSEVEFVLGQYAWKLELPDDFQENPPNIEL